MNEEYKRGYDAGMRGENIARYNVRAMNPKKAAEFTRGFMDGQRDRQGSGK